MEVKGSQHDPVRIRDGDNGYFEVVLQETPKSTIRVKVSDVPCRIEHRPGGRKYNTHGKEKLFKEWVELMKAEIR